MILHSISGALLVLIAGKSPSLHWCHEQSVVDTIPDYHRTSGPKKHVILDPLYGQKLNELSWFGCNQMREKKLGNTRWAVETNAPNLGCLGYLVLAALDGKQP